MNYAIGRQMESYDNWKGLKRCRTRRLGPRWVFLIFLRAFLILIFLLLHKLLVIYKLSDRETDDDENGLKRCVVWALSECYPSPSPSRPVTHIPCPVLQALYLFIFGLSNCFFFVFYHSPSFFFTTKTTLSEIPIAQYSYRYAKVSFIF